MATEGPNSPSTVVDDSSIGTQVWSNPGNAVSSNNQYASVALAGPLPNSHYLKATNFGFSIPTDATIDGILVEVEKNRTFGATRGVNDLAMRIVKGGTIGTTDKANSSDWGVSDSYFSYGGSTDLWGETWAYSDINATNFGAAIAAHRTSGVVSANVDHIRITVYYTEAAGTPAFMKQIIYY